MGAILARRLGFTRNFWDGAERLVYYALFPPLLFTSIVNAKFTFASEGRMLAAAVGAFLAAVALGFAGAVAVQACARILRQLRADGVPLQLVCRSGAGAVTGGSARRRADGADHCDLRAAGQRIRRLRAGAASADRRAARDGRESADSGHRVGTDRQPARLRDAGAARYVPVAARHGEPGAGAAVHRRRTDVRLGARGASDDELTWSRSSCSRCRRWACGSRTCSG